MPARPGPLYDPRDVPVAIGLLTRLPVQVNTDFALARGAASAWAWPLAGAVVAIIAGGCAWNLHHGLAVSAPLAAGLGLLIQVFLTGAMHEDGLADCADGFWGGWTRQRRLDIMKDSRIGAYGVLALILLMGLRWQLMAEALTLGWGGWGLYFAAQVLSRAFMVRMAAILPSARPKGLAASVGRPSRRTLWAMTPIATIPLLQLNALAVIVSALGTAILAHLVAKLAKSRIGGQTGDVLGAVQILTEASILLIGSTLLPHF